jgi:alanyl-tRNA synthetase
MFMILNTLSAIAVIEMENQVIQVSSRSEKWSRSFAEQDTILREFLYVTADQSKQTAVVEIKDVQESLGSVFVHKGIIRRVLEGRGRNRSCSGCKIEAAG